MIERNLLGQPAGIHALSDKELGRRLGRRLAAACSCVGRVTVSRGTGFVPVDRQACVGG